MDNGYRAITENDFRQEGDEVLHYGKWYQIDGGFGHEYYVSEDLSLFRRPIAQEKPTHYASDTKPVVDKLGMFDACANNKAGVNDTDVVDIAESQWLPDAGQDWKDGWPTVGKECEKLWDQDTGVYYRVNVIAQDYNNTIFRWLEGPSKGRLSESFVGVKANGLPIFRPLKTPEQLAAEEQHGLMIAFKNGMKNALKRSDIRTSLSSHDCDDVCNWLTKSGIDLSPLTKKDSDNE